MCSVRPAGHTGLAAEYVRARTEPGLTDDQLAAVAGTSLRHSGAPRELVDEALAGVEAWLRRPT
jgi:hypothetical protein